MGPSYDITLNGDTNFGNDPVVYQHVHNPNQYGKKYAHNVWELFHIFADNFHTPRKSGIEFLPFISRLGEDSASV